MSAPDFPLCCEVQPIRVSSEPKAFSRIVPAEEPVAVVCNGTTLAVMMATPADLKDFGVGFLLSEGVIASPDDIERREVVEHDQGIEVRHWLSEARGKALQARRRYMAGPTGCGLCGIESLEEAVHPLPKVSSDLYVSAQNLKSAMRELGALQRLNQMTRGVHAAAVWRENDGFVVVREDVGRHNALDKVIGALASGKEKAGLLLLTSRISIELIQKAAQADIEAVAAISVPTLRAIRAADEAGITLVGIARDDGFEIFSHAHRVAL